MLSNPITGLPSGNAGAVTQSGPAQFTFDPRYQWQAYGSTGGWTYDPMVGAYVNPSQPGIQRQNPPSSPFGDVSEGQLLQSLGLGQYVTPQKLTGEGDMGYNVAAGAPKPYIGYDPSTGRIIEQAFGQDGTPMGNSLSWADDGGGWMGNAIKAGALTLMTMGMGADLGAFGGAGGETAGTAGGGAAAESGGAGDLFAGVPEVTSPSIDAGAIGGVDSITTMPASGLAGAGEAGGSASFIPGADSASSGYAFNSTAPSAVDLGSAGGVSSTGSTALSGLGSSGSAPSSGSGALSNWWDKVKSGDIGAIRTGLQGVGLLSSLLGGNSRHNLSATDLRSLLNGPYNNFTPSQQASVDHFFASPASVQYVPPNVNGVVQLHPQSGTAQGALSALGLPSAGAGNPAPQLGHATIQPVPTSNPQLRYANGGHVTGALCQMATGGFVPGNTPGQADAVDAKLSHGEYVMDADTVSALGDGNNAAGAKKLDQMRQAIRAQKRSASADQIPPKAKEPQQYLKGRQ